MGDTPFNIHEIFEMAEQIEINGGAFYRKAAENTVNPAGKKMLHELALMEDGHIGVFANLRKELAGRGDDSSFDPEGEAMAYVRSIAATKVFDDHPANLLTGAESVEQILRLAISMEKEAILFYLGLKEIMPPDWGRDKVQAIIEEEKSHVVMLTNQLRSFIE